MLLARPAHAQLASLETAGLRLVYFTATESYLVPHAARTFLNSLAFQRRIFGLDPKKPVTVLMVDFSDAGNASATVVPRNNLLVDISPLSYEFETLATNERLNTIMNHELVHIATMDPAAKSDRMFRRLFGGKVTPVMEDPESILYFFLTTPRVAAPRWYHEGIAVFMDTWMAGGMGRAQSGYDEMVFRAMVRDNAPFYDPLGLVSEGTEDRFSTPDQLVPLRRAVHDVAGAPLLAGSVIKWVVAPQRHRSLLLGRSSGRSSAVARGRVAELGRRRARLPATESRSHAQVSADAVSRHHEAGARVGVARLLRPGASRSSPPSTTRASWRMSARSTSRTAPSQDHRRSRAR